ncbi:MAG: type IV pilus secretin PilQ [Candidatus Tectomicrobia bacterium]|uniref:Type IV pilus secretin PilQ n=1 Tax=Tectimicrobiota bacterium TaxID=2528274 RepID=A0A932FXQ9_UNCTE|nr:type IV pilus secretin PilQ [Candidatus Tectomicrobia bacterium]
MGAGRKAIVLFLVCLGWSSGMGCSSRVARLPEGSLTPQPSRLSPASSLPGGELSSSALSADSTPSRKATISRIGVRSLPGMSQVVIETDRPVRASLFKTAHPLVLLLDLEGAEFGFPDRDAMEVYDGLISSVRPRALDQQGLVRVEIGLMRELSHRLEGEGNRWILELKKEEEASAPRPIPAVAQPIPAATGPVSSLQHSEKRAEKTENPTEGEAEEEAEEEEKKAARPKYTGSRISLDFQDADIHTILRIIAEVSGLNVITSGDVRGKVTIRLIDVPWDQALDIILKTSGYAMLREGNIIRIAPPSLFQKEQQEILASRQTKEQVEDLVTQVYPINYATADELQPHVSKLLSARGSLTPDKRTNLLIVRDVEKSQREIRFLISTLDKQTPQVAIHARILEVGKDFNRDFGINWSGTFSWNQGTDAKEISGSVGAPIANPAGALGFLIDRISRDSRLNLDVELQALEANRKVKVVSSPRITTLDNREAVIKTGTTIPFQTVSAEGTQTQLVDAVTELSVTPHITSDGYISMRIKATRNEPDRSLQSTGAPAGINKREAETEVIIRDGDTLVIGGIFRKTDTTASKSVPFLNRVPVLGWLFRSDQLSDNNEELLIFITPHIVPGKPTA